MFKESIRVGANVNYKPEFSAKGTKVMNSGIFIRLILSISISKNMANLSTGSHMAPPRIYKHPEVLWISF